MGAAAVIDGSTITLRQGILFALCCAVSMLEGFDLQAMAFAAPDIARLWHIPSAAFGPVFSGGLLGGLMGGFLVGLLGSRLGPKIILLASIASFGLLTALTALATDIEHFLILRSLAGIGLGAAVPGIVAIVASYSPQRIRSTAVTLAVSCQFLGAVVGGAISAKMVPAFGWPSVFLLGGLPPLLLLPLLAWLLPEPIAYLSRLPDAEKRLAAAMRRCGKAVSGSLVATAQIMSEPERNARFSDLLAPLRRRGTILLWATCVVGSMLLYFSLNWLPSILRDAGASQSRAIMGGVALNAGGLIGALAISWLMDRWDAYWTIAIGFGVAVGALTMLAFRNEVDSFALVGIFIAGFSGPAAQSSLTALIVRFYPPLLHNMAVGAALGFARVGAVFGPLVGSYLLINGGGGLSMLYFPAALAGTACLTIIGMRFVTRVRVAAT